MAAGMYLRRVLGNPEHRQSMQPCWSSGELRKSPNWSGAILRLFSPRITIFMQMHCLDREENPGGTGMGTIWVRDFSWSNIICSCTRPDCKKCSCDVASVHQRIIFIGLAQIRRTENSLSASPLLTRPIAFCRDFNCSLDLSSKILLVESTIFHIQRWVLRTENTPISLHKRGTTNH